MGQKVHPKGLRLGIIKTWDSKWYAKKNYAQLLQEDIAIREFMKKRLANAALSRIEIERTANRIKITIHTAKPGIVIGRSGAGVDRLKVDLEKFLAQRVSFKSSEEKSMLDRQVQISVQEVTQPELDAQLVAENIAQQIAKRISFRRAMKQAVARSLRAGAQGVKITCGGRLAGAEIARSEWYKEGKIPLHTLRADIDYGFAESFTTYGQIGVKVWIYKSEVLPQKKESKQTEVTKDVNA